MSKVKFVPILFIALLFLSNPIYAQDLMSLEEVENLIDSSPNKEVQAYFHSVERGTQIKKYDVVLRGVLKQPGFKVIMFVTTHKIVAGMSGSPVYLNGKLVGAPAFGFY